MTEIVWCECTFCNGCDSDVPVGSVCLCSNCLRKEYCICQNQCRDNEGNILELEE